MEDSPSVFIAKALERFKSLGIDHQLALNLIENSFLEFFEIQKLVIPTLLLNNSRNCIKPRHICASAPTGSGKTLSYVVPILQAMNRNIFTEIRLKAVVILPTRELANQVFSVFCQLCKNMNVLVGIITGQTSFEKEQMMLVGQSTMSHSIGHVGNLNFLSPNNNNNNSAVNSNENIVKYGKSLVDVLVCTPGRLQDHLQQTPHFTLQHLQFLVLDEADRLLGNAYHNWVKMLIQASDTSQLDILSQSSLNFNQMNEVQSNNSNYHHSNNNSISTQYSIPSPFLIENRSTRHFQRLLFSATLTDNPGKLALLGVKNPLVFNVGRSYNYSNNLVSEGQSNKIETDETVELSLDDHISTTASNASDKVEKEVNKNNNSDLTAATSATTTSSATSTMAVLSRATVPTAASGSSSGGQIYYLPKLLTESVCLCDTARRPLALASLLYEACHRSNSISDTGTNNTNNNNGLKVHVLENCCGIDNYMIIVFTSSVATTNKLCTLLQLINNQIVDNNSNNSNNTVPSKKRRVISSNEDSSNSNTANNNNNNESPSEYLFGGEVCEISRNIKANARDEIMNKCKSRKIKILISTDQMARGIDLPNIKLVFNYDCPSDVKAYLHRVGRTARGNNDGHAITMLKIGQMSMFKKLHSQIESPLLQQQQQSVTVTKSSEQQIARTKTKKDVEEIMMIHYKKAIKLLPLVLADEVNRFTIRE